jgi:hypothetical protein
MASDTRERGDEPVIASDKSERGDEPVIASPKGVAISLFYEIASSLRSSQRLRRIAASLPATLRSRLRLILAMTSSGCHGALRLAMIDEILCLY